MNNKEEINIEEIEENNKLVIKLAMAVVEKLHRKDFLTLDASHDVMHHLFEAYEMLKYEHNFIEVSRNGN